MNEKMNGDDFLRIYNAINKHESNKDEIADKIRAYTVRDFLANALVYASVFHKYEYAKRNTIITTCLEFCIDKDLIR